jgi:hypothetical protein
MTLRPLVLALLVATSGTVLVVRAQRGGGPDPAADPFKGITADGHVKPGLFAIRATGVTTQPVLQAANQFIASLTPEQRKATTFPVDDIEWRRWNNIHRASRAGISFKEMTDSQRSHALAILRAGLSATGLEKVRNVMRLNETIAELTNNFTEYGEGLYNLTVMGEPSQTEPWGWQLEGHHLTVNYFVLGDQVVMTPTFMGSEPVSAESGKYKGTTVLQDEQNKGLALMRALSPEQQQAATIEPGAKTANKAQAQAFRDNLQIPFTGLKVSAMDDTQRGLLTALIQEYVDTLDPGHAKVRMDEVRAHLNETYFAWIGASGPESVFYYRVHSPVILIEFDHQTPVAMRELGNAPTRRHVHSVVRTPNGNDYGKDLLRLHYEQHKHDQAHGHADASDAR